jgi:hypothetical protein
MKSRNATPRKAGHTRASINPGAVQPVALPALWAAGLLYRCWRLRVEERLQERRYRAAIAASLLGVAATFEHDGSVTVVPTGLPPQCCRRAGGYGSAAGLSTR